MNTSFKQDSYDSISENPQNISSSSSLSPLSERIESSTMINNSLTGHQGFNANERLDEEFEPSKSMLQGSYNTKIK